MSSRSSTLTPCRSPTPEPPIVQPDHFYCSEGIQLPPSPHSDGKTWLDPNDDVSASRGIPVFKPTMEEFRDFEAYMERVNCWGLRSGIIKIIPPKEWTASLPDIKPQLGQVKIKSPIEQHMLGSGGLFRQQNLEKRKVMSVREWVELCNKEEYRAPAFNEVGIESRGLNVRNMQTRTRKGGRKGAVIADTPGPGMVIKEEPDDCTAFNHSSAILSPPISDGGVSTSTSSHTTSDTKLQDSTAQEKPKGRRAPQTREARQAHLADRAARDESFINSFSPHKDWLPPNMDATNYTPEFCQKLERHYWRNCGLGRPAWYGADMQGTLLTDETTVWNIGHLSSTLSRLLPASNKGLPGVNTPYLYFGMWRATFAWHVEDMDLYSINYIHFGAPKFWYAVPQAKATALEHAMRTYFPKDTSKCPQFLRHKSFFASPTTLAKSSCRPNHLVQHAGEFVITYPRGYHAGFNLGLNCAESVNFALDCWVDMGRVAKACQCIPDSVRIDVDQLLRDRAEEQRKASEPAHMSKRRSPKKSVTTAGTESVKQEGQEGFIPPLKISRKRKAEDKQEPSKAKKIKLKATLPKPNDYSLPQASHHTKPPPPKLSVTLKLGPKPAEPEPYPCCLCISMSKEGLLRVHDPPLGRKDAVDAANNPKVWMAHELCASTIPETWVDEVENEDQSRERVVFGVDGIVKDRWNLKCSACTRARPKAHGAPVQCTKGKCPKAFHVMCAKDGHAQGIVYSVVREVEKEVVLLESPTPVISDPLLMQVDSRDWSTGDSSSDNNQGQVLKIIKKLDVQILCAQHNPAVAAQKKASKQEKIRNELLALPSMSRIKIRVSSGVFEVSLIRVIEETSSVEVLWDRGIKREFKWGSVAFGTTDGPVQQIPSGILETTDHHRSVSLAASSNSIPVTTYPSVSAATSGETLGPSPTVAEPTREACNQNVPPNNYATNAQYPYPPRSNPYEYWTYPPQQMPYAISQTATYPYPYSGYYPNSSVPGPSQAPNLVPYSQAYAGPSQYRDGRIQWQRPYQGPQTTNQYYRVATSSQTPRNDNSAAPTQVSQPPPLAQSQTLSSDSSLSGRENVTNSDSETNTSPLQTPPSTSNPSSSQIGTQPITNPAPTLKENNALQSSYPDLSALAQLPPHQLTEILSNDPQLRDLVMSAVDQANRHSDSTAQPF